MPRKLSSWLGATILGLAGFALEPSAALAACQHWDVSGRWSLQQDNDYVVELTIQQNGNRLAGEAAFHRTTDGTPAPTNFTGKLDEDYLTFTVRWDFPGNPVGVYKGNIDSKGRMKGRTYDKAHPGDEGSAAFWRGNRTATCLDQAEPAPEVPALQLGKVKLPEGTVPPEICDAARSARTRGSPAAPGLEARCLAAQAAQP